MDVLHCEAIGSSAASNKVAAESFDSTASILNFEFEFDTLKSFKEVCVESRDGIKGLNASGDKGGACETAIRFAESKSESNKKSFKMAFILTS